MYVIQIVAMVVLVASLLFNFYQKEKVESFEREIDALMVSQKTNQDTINSLKDDIKNNPPKYIEITKEVTREVCEGKVLAESIMNLQATKKEVSGEIKAKSSVAGLDDRLPDELIRLLN